MGIVTQLGVMDMPKKSGRKIDQLCIHPLLEELCPKVRNGLNHMLARVASEAPSNLAMQKQIFREEMPRIIALFENTMRELQKAKKLPPRQKSGDSSELAALAGER